MITASEARTVANITATERINMIKLRMLDAADAAIQKAAVNGERLVRLSVELPHRMSETDRTETLKQAEDALRDAGYSVRVVGVHYIEVSW